MNRHLLRIEALVLVVLVAPLALLARLDRLLWPLPAPPPAPVPVAVVEPVAAPSGVRRTPRRAEGSTLAARPRAPRPRRKVAQGVAA